MCVCLCLCLGLCQVHWLFLFRRTVSIWFIENKDIYRQRKGKEVERRGGKRGGGGVSAVEEIKEIPIDPFIKSEQVVSFPSTT